MNSFTYDGVNSLTLGLFVEQYPSEPGCEKIIESIQIPGRTGALTVDTGALANSRKAYAVMFRDFNLATEKMREVRSWLAASSGYRRLTDTYDAAVFRLARVATVPSFESHRNDYGRGTIEFDVDPRRFLLTGETPILAPSTLTNPGMPSKPLIVLTVIGPGSLVIGDQAVSILDGYTGTIMIDSETMEVYDSVGSVSAYVAMPDFPVIASGASAVSTSGGVDVVSITPRWWMP